MYKDILEFKGTWRTYQARVLSRFNEYKRDKKIHIVAAPGSGKTTLGIELIKLLNEPCIVLAPSITIREQWVQRIEEAFLKEGVKSEDVLSQDLTNMKLITVTTYQSIHSAMVKYKGQIVEEIDEETTKEEIVDYEKFDIIDSIRKNNVRTLCLDECHHLRNEWWKSLEKFQKEISSDFTIALTATPPYDSTPDMWLRYMKVCGEIDEEITIPELVKDVNLCPHQDYVYFNYPTKEELDKLDDFVKNSEEYCNFLLEDERFKDIIKSHEALGFNANYDELLEDPAYLSSILIYLNAVGERVPGNYRSLLGYIKLEKISAKWFEKLLQGVLYDDCESYDIDQDTINEYRNQLKIRGLIEKRKVTLLMKSSLKKDLVRSTGKCKSIIDITFNEYNSMKDELRLLILCDYIKKEFTNAVGNLDIDAHALGVIPYFELIRRENESRNTNLKLAVLCGTCVIIPSDAKDRLLELVPDASDISFKAISNLSIDEYAEIEVVGNKHFLTGIITQLFEEGYFEVLIGTKSLLGEGWDSPCVNSLILASFVGSFMLSNQMRGRAIRTYAKNPNKASNIWHLVCVIPDVLLRKIAKEENKDNVMMLEFENEDIEMLNRRMENFLGLHYELDTIESGIERLSAIKYPISNKYNVDSSNAAMLKISSQRDLLKSRWHKALHIVEKMEIVDEVSKDDKPITVVLLHDHIRKLIMCAIIWVVVIFAYIQLQIGIPLYIFLAIFAAYTVIAIVTSTKVLLKCNNPLRLLKDIGNGIKDALEYSDNFDEVRNRVETETDGINHIIYLVGGSGKDKALFTKCVSELFDEIDNQRYILYAPHRSNKSDGYYPVPEIFSRRKEDVQLFAYYMRKHIGNYKIVYTRNVDGRKILLAGRKYANANKQNRLIQRKKVKSALE